MRRLFDCSVSCDFRGPLSLRGNSLIRELRHSSPSLGRAPPNVTLCVMIFLALLSCLAQRSEAEKKRRKKKEKSRRWHEQSPFRNVQTKNETVASVAVEVGGDCSVTGHDSKSPKEGTEKSLSTGPSSHLHLPVRSWLIYDLLYYRLLDTWIIFLCS